MRVARVIRGLFETKFNDPVAFLFLQPFFLPERGKRGTGLFPPLRPPFRWATVNKESGGGKKSGSGRGKEAQPFLFPSYSKKQKRKAKHIAAMN
jgi:hypothetical protein